MWVATVKIDGNNAFFGSICKKFNISALGFPMMMKTSNGQFIVYFTGIIFGDEKNKGDFVSFLKNHSRVIDFERHNDFITGGFIESKFAETFYNYNVIHKEPIKMLEDGSEIWTIASFDRKNLTDFIDQVEKKYNAEILKIIKLKSSNFSLLTVYPELTKPQKKAIEIAIKHGYYDSPRKIDVRELAKIMNLSYSTYHVHLRKAEKKLIPFFFQKA